MYITECHDIIQRFTYFFNKYLEDILHSLTLTNRKKAKDLQWMCIYIVYSKAKLVIEWIRKFLYQNEIVEEQSK